jgi:hypothetical protein
LEIEFGIEGEDLFEKLKMRLLPWMRRFVVINLFAVTIGILLITFVLFFGRLFLQREYYQTAVMIAHAKIQALFVE